jgi:hypothetical protein
LSCLPGHSSMSFPAPVISSGSRLPAASTRPSSG